jgi:hypothetical protein
MSETNGKLPENPFDNTIVFVVSIGYVGNSRQVRTKKKGKVRATKTLFESPEYEQIKSLAGAIRSHLRANSVPGVQALFQSGVYAVPVSQTLGLDEWLKVKQVEFGRLKKKIVPMYDTIIANGLKSLAGETLTMNGESLKLDNPGDYPSQVKFAAAFYMTYRLVSFGTPAKLQDLSLEVFKRESSKIQSAALRAAEDAEQAIYAMFQELLSHSVDRLTDDNGKKKKFDSKLIEKMRERVEFFTTANVTKKQELDDLLKKTKRILDGCDPEAVNTSAGTRALAVRQLNVMKEQVSAAIVNRPQRKVELED